MTQHRFNPADWLDVVRRRLVAVHKTLLTLRDTPFGHEALHDARVACRQAEAVLRVCGELLPERPVRWLQTHLRQLRHAGNLARDRDVTAEWLDGQDGVVARKLQQSLHRECMLDHVALAKLVNALVGQRRCLRHIKHACRQRSMSRDSSNWRCSIACQLLEEFHHFVSTLPTDITKARQLHRMRIATKRLRYACEFVAGVLEECQSIGLTPLLKQIQERLGQINDVVVRQKQFKQWARRGVVPQSLPDLTNEREQLVAVWRDWWNTSHFEEVLVAAARNVLMFVLRTHASRQ